MNLPDWLVPQVEGVLGDTILHAATVGGGCVSPAARLQTKTGRTYFAKWAADEERGRMFAEEVHSLGRIGETRAIRVPAVIGMGSRWILLEWLPPFSAHTPEWQEFGRALARLHRVQHDRFGWPTPNYIGPLPQSNHWSCAWPEFWRVQRLEPQMRSALESGCLSATDQHEMHRLFASLDDLLEAGQREGASLLHGDLWSGNALPTSSCIALIDPASYYGHREVDLAMAELFGGFPAAFWDAYRAEWPIIEAGWKQRRAAYQLYYLLVHLNLFGRSYLAGTRSALATALS